MRIAAPDGSSYWNPANDPSYAGLPQTGVAKVISIALFDNGRRVFGTEPKACGGDPPPLPDKPQGLTAAGGVGTITLAWLDAANATSYTVKRSTSGSPGSFALIGSPTDNAYVDSGLPGNKTYYYVVSAHNETGDSADSDVASATTANVPPTAPEPTATPGNQKVTLAWDAADGAKTYEISRANKAAGPFERIKKGLTTTSYVDKGLTNGKTYYYKVIARNGAGATPSAVVSAKPRKGDGGSEACTLTVDSTNDWGSGQVLTVSLLNSGTTTLTNWSATFTESNTFTIVNSWDGTFTLTGNKVNLVPVAHNQDVPPNTSKSAGMQISYAGAKPVPSAASVPGHDCTIVIK